MHVTSVQAPRFPDTAHCRAHSAQLGPNPRFPDTAHWSLQGAHIGPKSDPNPTTFHLHVHPSLTTTTSTEPLQGESAKESDRMAFGRGAGHSGAWREREGTARSTTRSMRLEGGRQIESGGKSDIHSCGGLNMFVCLMMCVGECV